MEEIVQTRREVELNQLEAEEILLHYVQKHKSDVLKKAIADFLLNKHGYVIKSFDVIQNKYQDLVIRAQVEIKKENAKGLSKFQPKGFKRKAIGFYKVLVEYLRDDMKKKAVDFDKAYDYMAVEYPSLNKRKFTIYCSDKRQQIAKGFVYDSKVKKLQWANTIEEDTK